MYEYLTGTITMVSPDFIVVDVQGVGYRVSVANPYAYQEDSEQPVRVYIYQVVNDDGMSLYGFVDQAQKRLFNLLISVSGIGPKSALAILATPDQAGLVAAIQNGDVGYLSKFPGIGKKTASRIIVELRDRVAAVAGTTPFTLTAETAPVAAPPALADAVAALAALGYTSKQVTRVKKELVKLPDQSTNDYLSAGLKLLSK